MFMKTNVYVNQKYFIVTNYRQLVVATFLYSILECFFFNLILPLILAYFFT